VLSSQLTDIKQHLPVGLNNFYPRILKDLTGESTHSLTVIFNKPQNSREMPEDW